jgi:hypothetical protein
MMAEEKAEVLVLFEHADRWCRDAEAHDANGEAVHYDDESAVAWDITGGLCRLFGWQRACVLFGQVDRHIHGKRPVSGWPARDPELDAMVSLQAFNDREDTTFEMVRERLESMPVWHRGPELNAVGQEQEAEEG